MLVEEEKLQPITTATYGRYSWVTGRRYISLTTAISRRSESSSNISDELAKSLHVDAKNVTTESTDVIRSRLSMPANSKSTSMSKFYKEMASLS